MSISTTPFRTTLLATGLITGLAFGFTATVTVTAAEATPEAHSDGMGAVLSDTAITAKVKAKLMGEKSLKHSDISVTTTNGVVTLEGAASSPEARNEAGESARAVDGVKSVYNGLTTPSASKAEAKTKAAVAETKRVVSDSWITTKVKSEILADSVSKGFEVNVDTTNGVVVLKGTLANQDAIDHVKDIAAKIEGVKSVDTTALGIKGK